MNIRQKLRKWLEIDRCVTVDGFISSWMNFKRKGTGIGLNNEEYPPSFENWMDSLREEQEQTDE